MKDISLPDEYAVEVKPHIKRVVEGKRMGIYGYCSYAEEKIVIGTKIGDVVNTIIHEKLHARYPGMSHEDVYKNADKIEGQMTLPEMAMQLLEIHQRSLNNPHKREMVYTEVSNIISRVLN